MARVGVRHRDRSGDQYFDPLRTRIRQYPVEVEGGQLVTAELADAASGTKLVKGPYTAETITVSVEADYLVSACGNPRRPPEARRDPRRRGPR